jgi:hypothetical protein
MRERSVIHCLAVRFKGIARTAVRGLKSAEARAKKAAAKSAEARSKKAAAKKKSGKSW